MDILKSKTFWIVIAIILLINVSYRMGKQSEAPWTAENERDAISGCKEWGGFPAYNSLGEYYGCTDEGGAMIPALN